MGYRGEVGVFLGGPVGGWVWVGVTGGEGWWWGEWIIVVTGRYGVGLRVVTVFPANMKVFNFRNNDFPAL